MKRPDHDSGGQIQVSALRRLLLELPGDAMLVPKLQSHRYLRIVVNGERTASLDLNSESVVTLAEEIMTS